MLTQFEPKTVEKAVMARWESASFYETSFSSKKPTFSIPLPPPNITGTLHLGHAFQQTLMDILIRFHKMKGYNVHWQGGTDHAGIATQLVVLRHLKQQGIENPLKLSKCEFMEHVRQWKAFSEEKIQSQMKRLALLLDMKQNRFTMDADYCITVQKTFCKLYNSGLIYRGLKLVNWDPSLKTAISDLEVNLQETSTYLWTLQYALSDDPKNKVILVATTRPETIFGDAAIAVHPDDPRYSQWIGHTVSVPLSQRKIPIIADSGVDPDFGTGAVKITPAHDFFDEKLAKKHQLPYIQLLDPQAHFLKHPLVYDQCGNQQANESFIIPESIVQKSVLDARKEVIRLLKEKKYIIEEKPHTAAIPLGDRTATVIEPHLTWQWFLKTDTLGEKARKVVENNDIEFLPPKYKNLYFSWMNRLEDWCISRQLVCGHPIPVWFDSSAHPYLGLSEAEVREKHNIPAGEKLHPCEDVLDTWFASALWTFAALERPNSSQTQDNLKAYHPYSLLITGFDIIFFWVARMIMLTLEIKKEIPFKRVLFTGLVRDESGKKMSKSQGNVLDPIDMIDGISLEQLLKKRTTHLLTQDTFAKKKEIVAQTNKSFPQGIDAHGIDAMRLTFAALAVPGRDLHWDMQRLSGYKNFCNKLWNATRFVKEQLLTFMQKKIDPHSLRLTEVSEMKTDILYQWIEFQKQQFLSEYHTALEKYRFDIAAQLVHDFFWHKFCDKFLEMAKPLTAADDLSQARRACLMLWMNLEWFLRAAHPIMPVITEYLWQEIKSVGPKDATLSEHVVCAPFPVPSKTEKISPLQIEAVEWLQAFIAEIRKFRRDHHLPNQMLLTVSVKIPKNIAPYFLDLQRMSKQLLKNVLWSTLEDSCTEKHVSLDWTLIEREKFTFFVHLSHDLRMQIQNERAKVATQLLNRQAYLQQKLNNGAFVQKAPHFIVKTLQEELETIRIRLKSLSP